MRYRVHGNAVKQTITFLGGCTTEATIPGLDASTNYFIEVVAVNRAGTGKYNTAIYAATQGTVK